MSTRLAQFSTCSSCEDWYKVLTFDIYLYIYLYIDRYFPLHLPTVLITQMIEQLSVFFGACEVENASSCLHLHFCSVRDRLLAAQGENEARRVPSSMRWRNASCGTEPSRAWYLHSLSQCFTSVSCEAINSGFVGLLGLGFFDVCESQVGHVWMLDLL